MIHSWMLYSSGVALLLGIAAHLVEGVLRERNLAIRPIWIAAGVGSVLLPTLSLLSPPAAPAPALTVAASVEAPVSEPVAANTTSAATAAARESAPRRADRNVDVDRWLLGAWGAASLLTLCGVAASAYLLRRRSREWAASRLDGHHVWISRETGPAVVGLFRSRIVIPEWVVDQDEAERTIILAHEDEHLRARDPHLFLGALLLLIALPWNLALWWQAHRLRQAVEVDCDRRVLARGVDAQRYSRLLVAVSERGTAHRLMVAALADSPSALERRIRLMLRRPPKRWMPRMLAGAVPAVLLVAVACGMPRPPMPSPQSALEAVVGQGMVEVDRPEAVGELEPLLAVAPRAARGDTGLPQLAHVVVSQPELSRLQGQRCRHRTCPSSASSERAWSTSSACIWKRPPDTGSSKPRFTSFRAIGFGSSTSHVIAIASRSNVAGLGTNSPRNAKRWRVSSSSRSVLRFSSAAIVGVVSRPAPHMSLGACASSSPAPVRSSARSSRM